MCINEWIDRNLELWFSVCALLQHAWKMTVAILRLVYMGAGRAVHSTADWPQVHPICLTQEKNTWQGT